MLVHRAAFLDLPLNHLLREPAMINEARHTEDGRPKTRSSATPRCALLKRDCQEIIAVGVEARRHWPIPSPLLHVGGVFSAFGVLALLVPE